MLGNKQIGVKLTQYFYKWFAIVAKFQTVSAITTIPHARQDNIDFSHMFITSVILLRIHWWRTYQQLIVFNHKMSNTDTKSITNWLVTHNVNWFFLYVLTSKSEACISVLISGTYIKIKINSLTQWIDEWVIINSKQFNCIMVKYISMNWSFERSFCRLMWSSR